MREHGFFSSAPPRLCVNFLLLLHSELLSMIGATWLARVALLALLIASFTLFWLRLRKVLAVIRGSRPDPGFTLAPLGPRIRRFLAEVLGQSKVIEQRRLPGLAHAFVFWGFCAFALITVNHIATGFGARFLRPDSGFGEYYFAFVAAWAALVAVSIAGLFIRRFFVRPRLAGQDIARIRHYRAADLPVDDHVPGRSLV